MRSAHLFRLPLTLITTLVMAGCLDDGSGGGNDASVGQLNYNGISGLSYQTASQTGTTNEQGEFRYYPGETIRFGVGDLPLVEGVPAQKYVTPLEFFADIRSGLTNPVLDDQGLSTHTLREQRLLDDATLTNMVRFLIALNWSGNVREDEGIEIRDRVIQQINATLPQLTAPIDFTVSEVEFNALGSSPSPANQLLAEICFYPEESLLCDEPPTQEEIDNAPLRPENEDERNPDIFYSEDLETLRDRIQDSIRTVTGIDTEDAQAYLSRELTAITTAVANRYYLDEDVATYPARDTALKTVRVRKIAGTPELAELEAISTRPTDVVIHATDWQGADVEYFVAGDTGAGSELLLNFRPEDTYRWVRKQLRVVIR